MKIYKVGLIALGFVGLTMGIARADHRADCNPIVALADQMQDHARDLSCEFERSYRWTPQYWELQANAQRVSITAGHLKLLARSAGDLREMKCDLDVISAANRNLSQLVCTPNASFGPGFQQTSWRHQSPPCQNDHVRRVLECLEKSICQANEHLTNLLRPTTVSVHRHGYDHDHRRPSYGYSAYGYGPRTSDRNPSLSANNRRYSFYIGR